MIDFVSSRALDVANVTQWLTVLIEKGMEKFNSLNHYGFKQKHKSVADFWDFLSQRWLCPMSIHHWKPCFSWSDRIPLQLARRQPVGAEKYAFPAKASCSPQPDLVWQADAWKIWPGGVAVWKEHRNSLRGASELLHNILMKMYQSWVWRKTFFQYCLSRSNNSVAIFYSLYKERKTTVFSVVQD